MDKKEFTPIDLEDLRRKAIAIKDNLERSQDIDRSEEFRNICLKNAIDISDTLIRDFDYYFDTKKFNGRIPMELENN